MRTKIFLVTALTALLAASAAFAGNGNGPAKMRYSFLGQLTATPANAALVASSAVSAVTRKSLVRIG